MPKYRYYCENCDSEFFVYHGMSDSQEECVQCSYSEITKLITNPTYKVVTTKENKVGDLTNKHIEDNRKILEEEKKKAREETYEPS